MSEKTQKAKQASQPVELIGPPGRVVLPKAEADKRLREKGWRPAAPATKAARPKPTEKAE